MDIVVYWFELVVGDVWTVWYTGWNWMQMMYMDGEVYWLELVVGDVWMVWYTGWNWLQVTCGQCGILVGTDQTVLTPNILITTHF